VLLLAAGPSLNGLLTHEAKLFEDALFSLVGCRCIARSILNDIEKGVKLGLEFRVALETFKKLR
jgi:hypothetical protein